MRRITLVAAATLTAALCGGPAWADAGGQPASQANCIGSANSGGAQGGFASSQATSLPPGQFGAQTSTALGGPHGAIGVVASSNNCG
jgi:hypothetical protein